MKKEKKKTLDLSILIPTLINRAAKFNYITRKLSSQIRENDLEDSVEILHYTDNRENTTGHKRNVLLNAAKGKFVVFVDDDDDVASFYVKAIVNVIREHTDIQAIGISGIYTENGLRPIPFQTGIKYNWERLMGWYVRYVNHISPILREVAIQIPFPDKVFGEDYDWTMKLKESGLIKKDYIIKDNIYFYKFISRK